MSNKQKIKLIHDYMNKAIAESKQNIIYISDNPSHPEHIKMIEKNKGYIMALEDLIDYMCVSKIN